MSSRKNKKIPPSKKNSPNNAPSKKNSPNNAPSKNILPNNTPSNNISPNNAPSNNIDPLTAFAPNRNLRSASRKVQKQPVLPSNNNKDDNNNGSVLNNTSNINRKASRSESSGLSGRTSSESINRTLSTSTSGFKNVFVLINDEEQEHHSKRKSSVDINNITKLPRLNEKDVNLLCKALQYSKSAYEEAIAAKEAAIRTELAINEFIKEWKNTSEEKVDYNDNKDPGKKKVFWYSNTLVKSCNDLFQTDKNPTDESMREAIYTALVNEHPDEVEKIEKTKDGWFRYWTEVLQSPARYEFRIKRANYVRKIKNATMNVFGKVFIGDYPGHKASPSEVLAWKTSKNARWAYENLWNGVDESGNDPCDTYISCITKEVLKSNERTSNNCLFIIAIVDLMFDPNIQTTVLSGESIIKCMAEKAKANEDMELQQKSNELDDEEAENENVENDEIAKDRNADDENADDENVDDENADDENAEDENAEDVDI
ncbi:uncharacterized protein OCT59_013891 [Rhizophagus irregularis]|uniref:uncharacterized protein n=1 Tax=Rhizophagus irregularis TaxID=588596 RepID=UPI000CA9842D|nr:hypothetical protein OCT59_013891 [Rhizophagus irregularis]GBC23239.1 hypothetical protein GLOIN_2v1787277 [Rhizophagus irregularis DAOM 181602=DAOM 197198]